MADYITLAVVIVFLVATASAYSRNDSIRLMDDMLTGYNRKHRPVMNQSNPVIINTSIEIISIQDFDEVNGIISMVVIMLTQWYDETIGWDPAAYGGVEWQVYEAKDIWYPLLVVSSSADKFESIVDDDWMTLRVDASGLVDFSPGLLVRNGCSLDVTYYPFDVQTCTITFTPWAMGQEEILLNSPQPYIARTFYSEHGQWDIADSSTYSDPVYGFVMKLVLRRKPLFAVVNTILPIIFMSVLNMLVFTIPVESGERISYTITVLLAIAVFLTLVSESLPKTSEPMSALSFFLMINLICSTSICLGTIWTVNIYFRNGSRKIPNWQRRLVGLIQCRRKNSKSEGAFRASEDTDENMCSLTWQDVSSALDKCLLIIFSLMIVVDTVTFIVLLSKDH